MSYNYWVSLHQHTDASNAGGYFEIVSKPEDYIKYAKKYNLPAVSFTEHGNVAMWIKKKDLVESAGLKYIHGIEAYSVMDLADKNRGYHTILLAKNCNGVKEINQLSSDSYNRKDGHFYYRPRILFSDLKEAVAHGNIIVTTACLAGPISQNLVDPDMDEEESKRRTGILNCWLDLAKENRDNVYLEVQPHDNVEQARLNNALQNYASAYDLKLIAANDIHAINQEHDRLRKIIKKGKHNGYDNDDQFELWCKTRPEMVDAFTKQGVLTSDNIQKALDATVDIAESVEEFEIDKSHKYPKLYENPEAEFKKRIKHGLIKRGINKLPKDEQNKYVQRVNREYKVYKHNGAIDYMLSHQDILNAAKEHGIKFGYGRGSCFIGETSILMSDYSTKRIQDVQPGDVVITHDGTPHKVEAVHRRKTTELVKTTFAGGLPLYSTKNHRFYVRKRGEKSNPREAYPVASTPIWGRADELRNSDLLCTPIPTLEKKNIPNIDLLKYGYDNTHYDTHKIWSEIGTNRLKRSLTKRFLDMSDPDIAWLSGVYVGNGWGEVTRNEKEKRGNHYRFGVCFQGDQIEQIERAKHILSSLVGEEHINLFQGYQGKNVVQIVVYNQFLPQFYLEYFGHYAANKKIPQFYMTSGNKEAVREFLKGMWQTDGHISLKEPRWKYSSTNKKLIEQLSVLMMSVGFFGNQRTRVHKEHDWNNEYTLCFSGGQLYKMNEYFGLNGKIKARWNRFKKDDRYFYGKVRKTEQIVCDATYVYDLTVEGNHSYIANGVAVHNCSGSLIAYLCGQTDMDSLKLGLNFERFMNPERISLADIDVDAYKPDQQWIQQWILTNPKWHAASIMTANTYGLKAAIKAIADGMDRYAGKPAYIQSIRNRIGDDGFIPTDLYEEHQQLIDDAKKVVGVIDSFGRHAAGIVIDTNTIDDTMGTQTISGWDYPVSQIAMTEIESRRWVKYDILGLDNIGLISRAAELAGIPFPTPDSDFIDFEDVNVWNSMRENNIGVFQMEGERAGKLLKDMLSSETIKNIRSNEAGKDVKYMDLLSLVNAAQRPAGSSYVDNVTHGRFKDNGHPALNKFLAPTLGELVYQEQLIQFLVEFCGYSAGKADVIRRGIGHKIKSVMDEEVPKIKDAFINTMITKYNDTKEHAEKIADDFIQVFMDAANYGFSINHSMAYSYIGYISTWLRYYYPVEWCTAAFQIWDGKQDKLNRVFKFAKENGISLKPVKFRKSKGSYYMDTQDKIIYEGTASIKGANGISGDDLYLLRDKHYQSFSELLLDIFEHKSVILDGKECLLSRMYLEFDDDKIANIDQSLNKYLKKVKVLTKIKVAINRRSLVNLILLDFFDEFGNNLKLKKVFDYFNKNYKPNNKRFLGKAKAFRKCVAYEQQIDNDKLPLIDQLSNELNLLGRCQTNNENLPAQYAFISDVVERSNKVQVTLYSVKRGVEAKAFIAKRTYNILKLAKGQLIKINRTSTRRKNVMVDGHWRKSNDSDLWVDDYVIIKG